MALERLQSGSDSTKPAAFLPLPVRLTAVAAAAIAGIGVLWSIIARVPVQVNGTAAIVPTSYLGALPAAADGTLLFQVSGLGPDALPPLNRRRNALLSRFWVEDFKTFSSRVDTSAGLNQLVEAALAPMQGQPLLLPENLDRQEVFDQPSSPRPLRYEAGTLLAMIRDNAAHQELNAAFLNIVPAELLQRQQEIERFRRAGKLGQLGLLQQSQRRRQQAELGERKELYQRYVALWKKGYLPGTTLLDEQNRINGLEAQLFNTDSTQLTNKMSQQDQLDQAKQASITNIETRNKLETQLVTYLNKTRLFAPSSGVYILSTSFTNGTKVKAGDEIINYTTEPPALPSELPVFLDGASAQQVSEGMTVLLTPKGIPRAQYGGIPGTVVEVLKLPLLGEGLLGVVGNRALAQSIQQGLPVPYLVRVRLEQAEPRYCLQALSRRCYRWSSGRLPPHPVRLATLADVQITTVYRRPIDFVMPALRRALGLVVDNQ